MAIKKVLVVDDSPTERFYLADLLTKAGFVVVTADSGEEAVSRAREQRPDLILMDVVMPGVNGFQVTRQITRDTDLGHIPVIMCTSKNQETDKIWGMRQGARDYVTKPINADELLSKIAALG
ncbi:response regulator transcription factor [Derxia gummosa]|uniref:Response regulator transcription factor n=1 Tax=Derxia gummosa DSM 723 TaxID=1121388 RepID=A0A8B6X5F5_9BURK|nr:response regulator [Derxia gummosa]